MWPWTFNPRKVISGRALIAPALLVVSSVLAMAGARSWSGTAQKPSLPAPAQIPKAPPPKTPGASGAESEVRFDALVRNDFFAGMAGDRTRFDRGMKFCEEVLDKNPKHAEALVWHGGGLLWLSSQVADEDEKKAMEMWDRGLREVDQAVALDPENIGIRIGRGAPLLGFSQMIPDRQQARPLVERGVADYEKTLQVQTPYFSQIPAHNCGELLYGLAEGWHRLGNEEKSQAYFQRIVKEMPGTKYAELAGPWLDPNSSSLSRQEMACIGCHVR